MSTRKTYIIMKNDAEIERANSISAAKVLADERKAEVYLNGQCVYSYTHAAPAAANHDPQPAATTATHTPDVLSYRLKSLMNVRKAPSMDAEVLSTLGSGTIVEVAAIINDWLQLTDGTFILYNGGEYAERY